MGHAVEKIMLRVPGAKPVNLNSQYGSVGKARGNLFHLLDLPPVYV